MTSPASAADEDAAHGFASAPDCLILPLKRGFFCTDLIDMPNFLVYNGRVVEKSTMENMMQQDVFEQFSLLILKMSKVVQKIKALEMVPFDLKAVHVMILYLLRMHREGLSVSELCRQTLDDKAAVSRAVAVLRERGYVIPGDARLSPVRPTKEGEELAAYITGRAACAVSEGGVGLSDEERTRFFSVMETICNNLEKYQKKLLKESSFQEEL